LTTVLNDPPPTTTIIIIIIIIIKEREREREKKQVALFRKLKHVQVRKLSQSVHISRPT
jgi:hypothetical protein